MMPISLLMHPPDPTSRVDSHGDELPELPISRSDDVRPLRGPASHPSGDANVDQVTWEIAAQLTAGMMANPSRTHATVKDAMEVFDEFLHELTAYARLSVPAPAQIDPPVAQPPTAAAPTPAKPRPINYEPPTRSSYVPGSMGGAHLRAEGPARSDEHAA